MKSSSYIFSLLFCCTLLIPACQKEKDITCKEEIIEVKVSPSVPQVKAPTYVVPSQTDIYVYTFNNPDETSFSGFKQSSIGEDGTYLYTLPAGTEHVMFTNLYHDSYYSNQPADIWLAKDFQTKTMTFNLRDELIASRDLVAGGACLLDNDEEGIVKVHLNRLVGFVSATLKFVDPQKNELTFGEYVSNAYLMIKDQATYVSCDTEGNVTVSDIPSNDFLDVIKVYDGSLCVEKPIFPTAQGMKGKIELHLTNHDKTETVLVKELNYAFERNKHYVLTITVKRNDTAFGGFVIEDVVTETIDIQLN